MASLSVILLLCALFEGIHGGVQIETIPSTGLFTTGTRVSIQCSFSNDLVFDSFVHPFHGQLQRSTGQYNVFIQNNLVILSFDAITEEDQGTYFCTFNARTGSGRDHELVELNFLPSVSFEGQVTRYDGLVGESLTMRCTVQNVLGNNINWWIGSELLTSSIDRFTVNVDVLTINPVRLEDNGTYTCVAGNTVSLLRIDVDLVVSIHPSANVTPRFLEVDLGEPADFICIVTAFPEPTVEWVELSTGVTVDQQYTYTVPGENFTSEHHLSFGSVASEHIGSYRCQATNRGGTAMAHDRAILNLIGTLGALQNIILSVVNQTNILVTWSAPLASVISYTVTWQSHEQGELPNMETLNGSNPPTTYLITNLQRLTMYTIVIYATNEKGRGVDSEEMNISTSAVAPSGQLQLTLFDISPESVQIEFNQSAVDDGGASLTGTTLLYSQDAGATWLNVDVNSTGPALLPNLQPNTQYQLRAQPQNEIGEGSISEVVIFTTSPEGYPGSPSHVTVQSQDVNTVQLCWDASLVGEPFTHYTVSWVMSNGSMGVWTVNVADLETDEECLLGATVGNLEPDACFQFTVTVSNSRGTGQSSGPSELTCTLPLPTTIVVTPSAPQADPLTMPVIVASVVVGVLFAVGLVVLFILCYCCCVGLRRKQKQKYNLPENDRRGSSRSDTQLVPYQHQSSSGSSMDTPPTASTQLSMNPFTFETSPHEDVQFYYSGSNTLGSSHTMGPSYPSDGHMIQPHFAQTLPSYYPSQRAPPTASYEAPDCEMIDNPYYKKFQLQKIPENEEHINAAYSHVGGVSSPPPVPPYYADDMSEVAQTEASFIPMGESYSQPSTSPRLKPKKHKHSSHRSVQPAPVDTVDFVDNNAYEIVPAHAMYSDLESVDSEPRFEIRSQQRGAVFETVYFKPN